MLECKKIDLTMSKQRTIIIPVLNGDGISDEIMMPMKRAVEYAASTEGVHIEWLDFICGERFEGGGIPEEALNAIRKYKVGIKGPMTTPVGKGYKSLNVYLRKVLNLYACVRPVKYYPGAPSPLKKPEGINMVIIRENTEDLYGTPEFATNNEHTRTWLKMMEGIDGYMYHDPSALSCKIISLEATIDIAAFAQKYAMKHMRQQIDIVTKANILKATDGLFLSIATDFFLKHRVGSIIDGSLLVDNACRKLVMDPQGFDVILTPNLYGDILSDLAAGLVGGLGFAPGANIGNDCAVFEATHGTAPDIAGKDIANPISLILSGKMMLEYLGLNSAATFLENAVAKAIGWNVSGKSTTEVAHMIQTEMSYIKSVEEIRG